MLYLQLFWEFFKTGLFAVGGGMATLPFLYSMGDKMGWFTQAQVADMVAVSESTPGPIGVNMATYVGYLTAGIPGSIIATLGLVTPSVIVILIVAMFLKSFRNNPYVERAFYGLRPASTALIAAAGLGVVRLTFFDWSTITSIGLDFSRIMEILKAIHWPAIILAAVLLVITRGIKKLSKVHPIVWIAASAVVGIVFRFAGA